MPCIHSVSSDHLIHVSSCTIDNAWLRNSVWISCLNVLGLLDWLLAVLRLTCTSCCLIVIDDLLPIISLQLILNIMLAVREIGDVSTKFYIEWIAVWLEKLIWWILLLNHLLLSCWILIILDLLLKLVYGQSRCCSL